MTKIDVKNAGCDELKQFKAHRVYKDDNFIIFYWSVLNEMWISNDVNCKNVDDLPDYIKKEMAKVLI